MVAVEQRTLRMASHSGHNGHCSEQAYWNTMMGQSKVTRPLLLLAGVLMLANDAAIENLLRTYFSQHTGRQSQ